MANNKKISEITVQASGGDLSGARYIAAVPDGGGGFSTKYVQGFGAGSAGGVIDQVVVDTTGGNTSTPRGTFPNYDPNTQEVFVQAEMQNANQQQAFSTAVIKLVPGATNISISGRVVAGLTAEGGYIAADSTNTANYNVYFTRFSKANLGGGGGGGFIDQVALTNSVSGTLADFDSNTQVVMVQCVSHSGTLFTGPQVEVPANGVIKTILTVGTGRDQKLLRFTLNSNGSYTSHGVGYFFYITRFGKQ